LDFNLRIKLKVVVGDISNHMPILLEIANNSACPLSPMKFNHAWLCEEDFKSLIKDLWIPLVDGSGVSYMQQFATNISSMTRAITKWAKAFNEKASL
jgi:hypothetical protein